MRDRGKERRRKRERKVPDEENSCNPFGGGDCGPGHGDGEFYRR
jgi:hypothetical protein